MIDENDEKIKDELETAAAAKADYMQFILNEIHSLSHNDLKTRAFELFSELDSLNDLLAEHHEHQSGELAAYLGITNHIESTALCERIHFYIEVARKALTLVQVDKAAMKRLADEDPGAYAQMLLRRRLVADNKIIGHYLSNQLLSAFLNDASTPYNEYVANRQEEKQLWQLFTSPNPTNEHKATEGDIENQNEYRDWFIYVESFNLYETPARVSMTYDSYSTPSTTVQST